MKYENVRIAPLTPDGSLIVLWVNASEQVMESGRGLLAGVVSADKVTGPLGCSLVGVGLSDPVTVFD